MLKGHKQCVNVGQIASRDIQVFKEFYISHTGNAHGPMYRKHSYGKLRVGGILRPAQKKARRGYEICSTGIHSFLRLTKFNRFEMAKEVWEAVIPKGTWFYFSSCFNAQGKIRSDRIKLVRRVRSVQGTV